MHDLPTRWSALCAVVFLLGMRHGLDADHIAAIDGMTRLNHGLRQRWARYCGALFALGHGAVVVSFAAMVGLVSDRWAVPGWVEVAGGWVSVAVLAALGLVNLHAAWRASPGVVVGLVGFKGALFGRIVMARGPWASAAVGALFALSFDTIGQAALMAVAAAPFGGLLPAVVLGVSFTLGMLLIDGLNGWWVAHLILKADRLTALASRIMAFTVAAVSLGVAGLGASRLLSPVLVHGSNGKDLMLTGAILGAVACAFTAAWVGRQRRAAPG